MPCSDSMVKVAIHRVVETGLKEREAVKPVQPVGSKAAHQGPCRQQATRRHQTEFSAASVASGVALLGTDLVPTALGRTQQQLAGAVVEAMSAVLLAAVSPLEVVLVVLG